MRTTRSKILSLAIGAAMLGSSTLAAASPAPAPATNPWVTLSMLNPAGAAALGGAAIQAGTYDDRGDRHFGVPLPVLAVWLAVVALDIYILTAKDHGRGHIHIHVPPISPT